MPPIHRNITKSNSTSESSSQRPPPRPPAAKTIQEANFQLLHTGRFSDFTITCRGERFRVHQSIVCPQSEFFGACLESGMKETDANEIELVDELPADVRRLLEFLYVGRYWEHDEKERPDSEDEMRMWYESMRLFLKSPGASSGKLVTTAVEDGTLNDTQDTKEGREKVEARQGEDPLMVNVRMYCIADKFGIPGLRSYVLGKVKKYHDEVLCFPGWLRQMPNDAVPEESPERVLGQWERICDAAEECGRSVDRDDIEFLKLILDPIARTAPMLMKGEAQNELAEEDTGNCFQELLERIRDKPELATCLFERLCVEVKSLKARRMKEVEAEKCFKESVQDVLAQCIAFLTGREKFLGKGCPNNGSGGCPATILLPMVVRLPTRDQDGGISTRNEAKFFCQLCKATWPTKSESLAEPGLDGFLFD